MLMRIVNAGLFESQRKRCRLAINPTRRFEEFFEIRVATFADDLERYSAAVFFIKRCCTARNDNNRNESHVSRQCHNSPLVMHSNDVPGRSYGARKRKRRIKKAPRPFRIAAPPFLTPDC